MKYNLDWVKQQYEKGERLKYIFFWGHQKSRTGAITKSCFSQWWEQSFDVNGIIYLSAEHWMMAEKARLFKDEPALQKILNAVSPVEAKKLGRQVKHFDQTIWETNRCQIVTTGNWHKFVQVPELADFLLQTNDRIIVEASPYDKIWGIGLKEDAKEIKNPYHWDGLNLLGFSLMEVRDRLRETDYGKG